MPIHLDIQKKYINLRIFIVCDKVIFLVKYSFTNFTDSGILKNRNLKINKIILNVLVGHA